jgi:hypothetical protein
VINIKMMMMMVMITIKELQNLDRKMRKLLITHGQHDPKADIGCLYVPRKQGGRGLMQLEEAYAAEITKWVEYVDSNEDPLIQTARTHQHIINSAMLQTARLLNIELERGTRQIKDSIAEKTKEKLPGRRMHG